MPPFLEILNSACYSLAVMRPCTSLKIAAWWEKTNAWLLWREGRCFRTYQLHLSWKAETAWNQLGISLESACSACAKRWLCCEAAHRFCSELHSFHSGGCLESPKRTASLCQELSLSRHRKNGRTTEQRRTCWLHLASFGFIPKESSKTIARHMEVS